MKKEKSCGAIIYNNENKVLIVKHNEGHWDFPKGHMEKGEDEYQTAIREVKEETSVDIELYKNNRYTINYSPKEDVDKTVVFFLAKSKSDILKKQDSEIANIGWFSYDEALEVLTYNTAKELLKKSYSDLNSK